MAKYAGRGTVWQRCTAADFVTAATIPNVREVTPGAGSTRSLFDQSSYGDDWMDFGVGQQEGDEMTLTAQYDPANAVHISLKSDFTTPVANTWLVAYNAASTKKWKITTVPVAWRVNPDRTGSLEVQMTFKIVQPGVVEATGP
jgi:hypothetical protein